MRNFRCDGQLNFVFRLYVITYLDFGRRSCTSLRKTIILMADCSLIGNFRMARITSAGAAAGIRARASESQRGYLLTFPLTDIAIINKELRNTADCPMSIYTPRSRPSMRNLSSSTFATTTPTPRRASAIAVGEELRVGDAVNVPGGMDGVVRFVGEVKGKPGVFVGVELSRKWAARGKNDGDADG